MIWCFGSVVLEIFLWFIEVYFICLRELVFIRCYMVERWRFFWYFQKESLLFFKMSIQNIWRYICSSWAGIWIRGMFLLRRWWERFNRGIRTITLNDMLKVRSMNLVRISGCMCRRRLIGRISFFRFIKVYIGWCVLRLLIRILYCWTYLGGGFDRGMCEFFFYWMFFYRFSSRLRCWFDRRMSVECGDEIWWLLSLRRGSTLQLWYAEDTRRKQEVGVIRIGS